MKVVIAIDAFKGCLSSMEAALAAKEGVLLAHPQAEVVMVPLSDGGEGMLEALQPVLEGQTRKVTAHDPLMNIVESWYVTSKDNKTAYIEMALINGLPLVPIDKRNPLYTSSFGLGELILDALELGCRNFVVGLGGSATNDAGIGMLSALGYRFYDSSGGSVGIDGAAMTKVTSINNRYTHPALQESVFTAICDVSIPFCGDHGAAYLFGAQKGATPEIVTELDRGLTSFAGVVEQMFKANFSNVEKTGAAGGLGGAFLWFFNAKLQSGIDWVLDFVDFMTKAASADLILTGEGKADIQTLMGKAPFGVLAAAKKVGVPVVLISGIVHHQEELLSAGFEKVYSINPPNCPLSQAMIPSIARNRIRDTLNNVL